MMRCPRRAPAGSLRSRIVRAAATGIASALIGAGCDPCAGVVACSEAPRLGVSGQIVDRGDPSVSDSSPLSGANIPEARPVAGVRVEVIPTAGAAAGAASAATTTDGTGWWTVSIPARDTGAVTADVVVTAPGTAGYRVRAVQLRATGTRGGGNVLGRWTHQLYLTTIGEVISAPTGDRPVGALVSAIRRGGIEVAPTRNTQNPMVTTDGGRFVYDVRPLADGPIVLDFVIARAGFPPATVSNDTLYPQHEWLPPNVDGAVIFRLDSAGNRVAQ